MLVAHLYLNMLNYKRIHSLTVPLTTKRSTLTRVDVMRRHLYSATSLRRKNKRVACNLLRCVIGTISETFCNEFRFMGPLRSYAARDGAVALRNRTDRRLRVTVRS